MAATSTTARPQASASESESASASASASTAASATATAAVETQTGRIHGTVEYREGDGPMIAIRPGAVGVQITPIDATLSWQDGDTRGSAAMPIGIFRNYVARGAIQLNA